MHHRYIREQLQPMELGLGRKSASDVFLINDSWNTDKEEWNFLQSYSYDLENGIVTIWHGHRL